MQKSKVYFTKENWNLSRSHLGWIAEFWKKSSEIDRKCFLMSHQQKMLQIGRSKPNKKFIQLRQRKQTFAVLNTASQWMSETRNCSKINFFLSLLMFVICCLDVGAGLAGVRPLSLWLMMMVTWLRYKDAPALMVSDVSLVTPGTGHKIHLESSHNFYLLLKNLLFRNNS